jgi:hypothetical protein
VGTLSQPGGFPLDQSTLIGIGSSVKTLPQH